MLPLWEKEVLKKEIKDLTFIVDEKHLVLKNSKKTYLNIMGGRKPIYVCYHTLNTGEIHDSRQVRYLQKCDMTNCISHYEPIRINIDSIREISYYDHIHYMKIFEQNTRILQESNKINYHDKNQSIGDCIIWTGSLNKAGYARANYFGVRYAHSFSFILWNLTEIPQGFIVRHKCIRQRNCVNPDHLELGYQKDNSKDTIRDGTVLRGEKNASSKLTIDDVKEIRCMYKKGVTIKTLANKYAVSETTILHIKNGKTWSYLLSPEEKDIIKIKKGSRSRILSFKEVEQIKNSFKKRKMDCSDIANEFKTTTCVIQNILENRRYLQKSEEQKKDEYIQKTKNRILKRINKKIGDDKQEHWLIQTNNADGYAHMGWKSKPLPAHIVSYLAFNNMTPEYITWECMRHKCLFKNCVNPDHLEPGTFKENSQDMIRDKTSVRGERHPKCKISQELAKEIKRSKGNGTALERAKKYGVPRTTVEAIDCKLSWAWLKIDGEL